MFQFHITNQILRSTSQFTYQGENFTLFFYKLAEKNSPEPSAKMEHIAALWGHSVAQFVIHYLYGGGTMPVRWWHIAFTVVAPCLHGGDILTSQL